MKEIKTEKYRGSFILKFAVLCFAAFIVYSLVAQQIKIASKSEELDGLKAQLKVQEIRNEEREKTLSDSGDMSAYAEKAARRDFDYARPGERIFVDVGGND